jgi:hypothetical protein
LRAARTLHRAAPGAPLAREVKVWALNEIALRQAPGRLRSGVYQDRHRRVMGPELDFLGVGTPETEELLDVIEPRADAPQPSGEARQAMRPAKAQRQLAEAQKALRRDPGRATLRTRVNEERQALRGERISAPIRDWNEFVADLLGGEKSGMELRAELDRLITKYDKGLYYYHYLVEMLGTISGRGEYDQLQAICERLIPIVQGTGVNHVYSILYKGIAHMLSGDQEQALATISQIWPLMPIANVSEEFAQLITFEVADWYLNLLYRADSHEAIAAKLAELAPPRTTAARHRKLQQLYGDPRGYGRGDIGDVH